ncbi:DUF6580 family putative transport protein [Olivibacter sitiensis]|uniref:DUF6580 family putative transport protein n=1 Tax=Olivibacter sitiensis TaxID=376470 RepID=UPI0004293850|nr:DUF6580 family putative transport protein [Olivibacter sitiensis]
MAVDKFNFRNIVIILMIIAASAFRLVHFEQLAWANFTPIGAMALFGGTYFKDKWKAYLVPLMVFLLTDWIINYTLSHQFILFYDGAFFVYLAFLLMVYVGTLVDKVNVVNVLSAGIVSVVIHWLVADIGTWWSGMYPMYPRTLEGYLGCLIAAIPFERNLLLGNLVFGAILYGGFEWMQGRVSVLRPIAS